ncbi:MAG: hypothetical protein DSY46_05970 [Hydrogenimonas sp.]|nr:MAG: hypothetical protein DSY46_05970 [Hydrogenimonas sp.]
MSWIDQFKIALIEENEAKMSALIDELPTSFESEEDVISALALIAQAKQLFEKKRAQLKRQMNELERTREFLISSEKPQPSSKRLDIHF